MDEVIDMNKSKKIIIIYIIIAIWIEILSIISSINSLTSYNVDHKEFILYLAIMSILFAILLPAVFIIYWKRGSFKKYLN